MLAIELKSISKSYPGVQALENIDLSVREKTVHGFLGPNGAGKSTTMKIITGLISPSFGSIKIFGQDYDRDHASGLIGHLPENPPLYLNMRVRDYLSFCQRINEKVSEDHLNKTIERVGLESVQHKLIVHLSKGYKQRVGLAQTLVNNAPILILDEPMVGLDPHAVKSMRELIIDLKKEHTILLCTHQLEEAAKVCDEVTIIEKGKVRKTGSMADLESNLNGDRSYILSVSNNDDNLLDELQSIEGLEIVSVDIKERETLLTLKSKSKKDVRADISKTVLKSRDLYHFSVKQLSLEDIFKKVVKK